MKTKIYLFIFAILIIITGYTLYQANAEGNTEKEKDFKVENFEDVTEINITDRMGKNMNLKKVDDKWLLNDKYPVRELLFEEMKEALTKMEAYSPVPNIGKNTIVQQMVSEAVKVEVFKGRKKDKVIYVGGPNLQNNASHMYLEIDGKSSKQIYNVGIPGFRGYLTTRFLINENEWRSKEIFSYLPSEVKTVEVKYFKETGYENFILTNEKNNFTIETDGKKMSGEDLNLSNIVNYLKMFENQQVMSYVFSEAADKTLKDSLLVVNKFAEFSLTDQTNKTQKITIVDMPLNESSKQQYDANGDPMAYDVDYKFVIFGEKSEWGVITNERFGRLLVSPYLFLKNNIKQ